MLDSHNHIACGPESSLLTGSYLPNKLAARFDISTDEIWQLHRRTKDHALFVETFLDRYATNRNKVRWAEKTPQNIRHIGWIFQHFPRARFIHILRDGRDVVCSIRTHPRFRVVDGRKVLTNIRRPLRYCINSWLRDTAAGIQWRGHPNYLEIHYRNLVEQPEATLQTVCAFIQEPFDPAMLHFHQERGPSRDATRFITNEAATTPIFRSSLDRWREELDAQELELFYRLAGERLALLKEQPSPPNTSAAKVVG